MNTHEKFRAWVKENGIKQRWAAHRLGVHESQLSLYLSGKRIPTIEAAVQIETLTGGLIPVSDWGYNPKWTLNRK